MYSATEVGMIVDRDRTTVQKIANDNDIGKLYKKGKVYAYKTFSDKDVDKIKDIIDSKSERKSRSRSVPRWDRPRTEDFVIGGVGWDRRISIYGGLE